MRGLTNCLACGAELTPETNTQICPKCREKYGLGGTNEKPKIRHAQHEGEEQEYLFEWASLSACAFPELSLLFHIPNGGKRNKAEAIHFKKQGVKAGIPDLFLPVARGIYHGLFIELKYGSNKPTENQNQWAKALTKQGYKCLVCYGWQNAAEAIEKYLKIGRR